MVAITDTLRAPAKRRLWGAVLMGLSLLPMTALGYVMGWHSGRHELDFAATLPFAAPALLLIVPGMLLYWSGVDELAQEAHRRAWFWGGSFGLAFGLFLAPLAPRMLEAGGLSQALSRAPLDFQLQVAIVAGSTLAAGMALLGYALVWIAFWLSKR